MQICHKLSELTVFERAFLRCINLPFRFLTFSLAFREQKALSILTLDFNPNDSSLGKVSNRLISKIAGSFIQIAESPIANKIQGLGVFSFNVPLLGPFLVC